MGFSLVTKGFPSNKGFISLTTVGFLSYHYLFLCFIHTIQLIPSCFYSLYIYGQYLIQICVSIVYVFVSFNLNYIYISFLYTSSLTVAMDFMNSISCICGELWEVSPLFHVWRPSWNQLLPIATRILFPVCSGLYLWVFSLFHVW